MLTTYELQKFSLQIREHIHKWATVETEPLVYLQTIRIIEINDNECLHVYIYIYIYIFAE